MTEPLPPAVTYRPNGVTVTLNRQTVPHQPGNGCVNHCYSHHIDEPTMGYEWCGECFHVFPTARALRSNHRRDATRVYWRELRHPTPMPDVITAFGLDPDLQITLAVPPWPDTALTFWDRHPRLTALYHLVRLPFVRARNITFCPHCTHDL